MIQAYWLLEFFKVLAGYSFVMYIWPLVVFRTYLSGKSRTYRYLFCVCVSVVIINSGVLMMGLVGLLKIKLVKLIYIAVFIIQFYRNFHLNFNWLKDIVSVMHRTISLHHVLLKWANAILGRLGRAIARWWKSTKGIRLEMLTLIAVLVFGTMYFSVNALEVHSYGFGDTYVHHSWIYGLKQGKIFSSGIYPEGMHCVVYLIAGLFNINTYSTVLFIAGAHIHTYLISAYLLMRILFKWKFTPFFALAGFLTVDQLVINTVFGMSRLGWTVPQEFGLFTVYIIPYALISFLRKSSKDEQKLGFKPLKLSWWKQFFADKEIILFMLSVAASVAIHFYAAIIAVFICIVIAGINVVRLFKRNKFVKLLVSGMAALFIAFIPMVGAYVTGHKLQGSLFWAVAVARGGEEAWARGDYDPTKDYLTEEAAQHETKTEEKLSLKERLVNKWNTLYNNTYHDMYKRERGDLLFYANIGVAGLAALVAFTAILIRFIQRLHKTEKDKLFRTTLHNSYFTIAATLFVLCVAYNPASIGLPPIVAGSRVCSTIQMFAMMIYAAYIDIVFTALTYVLKDWILKPLSICVIAGIYVFTHIAGVFHGYLYYELTRYPALVEMTKEITTKIDKNTFTIVSTTDELYQLLEWGYHDEWIDFIEQTGNQTYTLPTTYVFFYIEKKPIQYAQSNFATGPKWLAEEKYVYLYDTAGSQYPNINHGTISEFYAEQPIDYGKKRSDTANSLGSRQVLESKAYKWYLEFSSLHPNAGEIIYEDDDVLCYCIRQNGYSLFSTGVLNGK